MCLYSVWMNQIRILHILLLCNSALYGPEPQCLCLSFTPSPVRVRSDAPVIRRKTPPRRQRVLSPSPAQWSPGSSLGWWCKSFLFIPRIEEKRSVHRRVAVKLRFCGYCGRLRQCALPRRWHGHQDQASVCRGKQIRVY